MKRWFDEKIRMLKFIILKKMDEVRLRYLENSIPSARLRRTKGLKDEKIKILYNM